MDHATTSDAGTRRTRRAYVRCDACHRRRAAIDVSARRLCRACARNARDASRRDAVARGDVSLRDPVRAPRAVNVRAYVARDVTRDASVPANAITAATRVSAYRGDYVTHDSLANDACETRREQRHADASLCMHCAALTRPRYVRTGKTGMGRVRRMDALVGGDDETTPRAPRRACGAIHAPDCARNASPRRACDCGLHFDGDACDWRNVKTHGEDCASRVTRSYRANAHAPMVDHVERTPTRRTRANARARRAAARSNGNANMAGTRATPQRVARVSAREHAPKRATSS